MDKANILIVEDEPIIAHDLKNIVIEMGYNVVDVASSYKEAVDILDSQPVDLVLLDVMLEGKKDGVDIARYINENTNSLFIFLTSNADKQTVSRAKETYPSGYLVKPFNEKDIQATIEVVLFNQKRHPQNKAKEQVLSDVMFVKDHNRLIKIKVADILFAEANDNYTNLYVQDKKFLLSSTLKSFEEKLSGQKYIRVHRSYLVNIEKIESIVGNEIDMGVQKLPIGKSYKTDLMSRINLI